jgi:hypothetical protein
LDLGFVVSDVSQLTAFSLSTEANHSKLNPRFLGVDAIVA